MSRVSDARNRYKIRDTRNQDRLASLQVKAHDRVFGTHREKSRWAILQRLALYGHTVRGDITQDAKLAVLVECPDLVVDRELHHEAMSLIAAALPAASPPVVDQLVVAVRDHETSDRIRFHKLAWIAHHAAGSPTAKAAFDAEQASHPDWRVSEHPDFLQWVEITTTSGTPDHHRADLPNLASLMVDDPAKALELIVSHYTDSDTDTAPSPGWFCNGSGIVSGFGVVDYAVSGWEHGAVKGVSDD